MPLLPGSANVLTPQSETIEIVTLARILWLALAIAILPPVAWWVITVAITDPDEGANIGAGLVGLVIVALSFSAAVGFLITAIAKRRRRA